MSAFANASVMEAARHFLQAISTWLEQHGDRTWQAAKTAHDIKMSEALQAMLAQPELIPADMEWRAWANILTSKAADDEEWAETTQWWEVFVSARGVRCVEYSNLATIIGAGQTYVHKLNSTDADSAALRREVEAWRKGLDDMLTREGVSVNVSTRKVP